MNRFKKAKLNIELLEAAHGAILDEAIRQIRYDESEYLDADYDRDQGCRDPEYLKQHLSDQGKELLKQAQDLADRIEGVL